MKIYNEVNNENVRKAASLLIKHCQEEDFIKLIRGVTFFNHTIKKSDEVASRLLDFAAISVITLRPYKTFNPFSNVTGYSEDWIIFINERHNYMPVYDRVGSLYHEICHMAGFNHQGDKTTAYNLKTVPYLAGQIFAKYVQNIYE